MRYGCAAVLLTLIGLAAAGQELQPPVTVPAGCHPEIALFLRDAPKTGWTKQGIPGDPLNIVLVGTRAEVCAAFQAAGWYPADPITLCSSVGITVSVIFNVPYPQAPVSPLYLFGRKQDLAFEEPAARSARSRHHVRIWCAGPVGPEGRMLWFGADTFDASVGRSATTGKPTHHIAPDIDKQRDMTMSQLQQSGWLVQSYLVPHIGPTVGRNGEGDCYFTDGNLAVGILRHDPNAGCCCGNCAAPCSAACEGGCALEAPQPQPAPVEAPPAPPTVPSTTSGTGWNSPLAPAVEQRGWK